MRPFVYQVGSAMWLTIVKDALRAGRHRRADRGGVDLHHAIVFDDRQLAVGNADHDAARRPSGFSCASASRGRHQHHAGQRRQPLHLIFHS